MRLLETNNYLPCLSIDFHKTFDTELVFHRPSPCGFHIFNPIDEIKHVNQIRLLGIAKQDTSNVEARVNYVLSICSQDIF